MRSVTPVLFGSSSQYVILLTTIDGAFLFTCQDDDVLFRVDRPHAFPIVVGLKCPRRTPVEVIWRDACPTSCFTPAPAIERDRGLSVYDGPAVSDREHTNTVEYTSPFGRVPFSKIFLRLFQGSNSVHVRMSLSTQLFNAMAAQRDRQYGLKFLSYWR